MQTHVGYLIKNISDKMRCCVDEHLKEHNLTFQQSKVIAFLAMKNNQASQKQIEDFLKVSHPTVVGIISRMEQNGYLTTFVDKIDKRNKIVKLTPKAIEKWDKLKTTIDANEKQILKGLTDQQKLDFIAFLEQVYKNLI